MNFWSDLPKRVYRLPYNQQKCIKYAHLNHLKWSKIISNMEGHEKSLPTMIYTEKLGVPN